MTDSFAVERLQQERKRWRQDHPPDFIARPKKGPDGQLDIFHWECLVPGKPDTHWAGGYYPVTLDFPKTYPSEPPVAKFVPPVPHVNVFPSGTICLSILHANEGWKPSMNLRQILLGIQGMLDAPNPDSPAHQVHYDNFMMNRSLYFENIKRHASKYRNPELLNK